MGRQHPGQDTTGPPCGSLGGPVPAASSAWSLGCRGAGACWLLWLRTAGEVWGDCPGAAQAGARPCPSQGGPALTSAPSPVLSSRQCDWWLHIYFPFPFPTLLQSVTKPLVKTAPPPLIHYFSLMFCSVLKVVFPSMRFLGANMLVTVLKNT